MARVVRWMLASAVCAGVALVTPVYSQPQPAGETAAPAAASVTEPSPLLREPKTPEETFEAIVLLVDLARYDLAKVYLKAFVDGQPSDELLQALRDQYSTGEFIRLTRIPELKESAQPLLDRLNAASRKQAEDPAYIDGLITRLTGTTAQREQAFSELRNAGVRAVPQILSRLAKAKAAERDMIVLALSRMGQPVIPAVIAGLDANNDVVRHGCIEALKLLNAHPAVPRLWVLAYGEEVDAGTRDAALRAIAQIQLGHEDRTGQLSKVKAVEDLSQGARQLLTAPPPEDPAETMSVWQWNSADQTLASMELNSSAARLSEAQRLARDAFLLNSEHAPVQTLYLTTLLAGEVAQQGWEAPLTTATSPAMQIAVATGVAPLMEVLRTSLETDRIDAAWAALQGLSALASPEVLARQGGKPSPVLAALNYPDPRLQFAAAIVVLRSDTRLNFPGASRVTDVLRRALTAPGSARAVVIDGDEVEGRQIGNYVNEEGFDPLLARTGREGFQQAADTADVSLIVVQTNVANWPLTQTLANLRADARTAYIPIVVYGPESVRNSTARLVSRTGNAVYAGESPGSESFWLQVRPLLQRRITPPVSGQQRQDFKVLAAYWLANLSEQDTRSEVPLKDVQAQLLPLVSEDSVAANALQTLGQIGSVEVQSNLAQFTLNDRLPIETRRLAAQQLTTHIPRFGLLLSESEVSQLTKAWDQEPDAELRGALASIVGELKPNTGLVGERLRRLALPAAQ